MGLVEDDVRGAKEKKRQGGVVEILESVGKLLGEDGIDQTGITTEIQTEGQIAEEAYNSFLLEWFGFEDEVSLKVCERRSELSPSIKGQGGERLVKIFSSADLKEGEERNKLYKVP